MSNIDNDCFKEELDKAHKKLAKILADAKQLYEDEGLTFESKSIGVLWSGTEVYQNLYIRTGLMNRQTLETAIGKAPSFVKKEGEILLDVEEEWKNFLESMDILLKNTEECNSLPSVAGQLVDLDIQVKEVTLEGTNEEVTLGSLVESQPTENVLLVLNRHFS